MIHIVKKQEPIIAPKLEVQKKVKKPPKQEKKRVKRNEIQKGFKRIVKKDLADPEIDAILDKILEGGMERLSPQEKLLLESRSSLSEND